LAAEWKKAAGVLALGLVLLLPPLIWWKGLASPLVGMLLFATGSLQLVAARSGFGRLQGAIALSFAFLVFLGSPRLTLYYPVLVNAALLLLWAYSLFKPPTVIERIARKSNPTTAKRRYMRRLTLAWCGVFTVNLLMALMTTLQDDLTWWLIWNGLGAYLLVGVFAVSEYLFRIFWHERTSLGNAA
jgi:uncharacterized membrane protein